MPAAALGIGVAVVLAFLGGVQLVRGFGRWQNRVLAIGFVLFVFAFLAWAAAGKSFNLVGMLRTAVERSTPITFGALAGLLGERVAVINIAIEGQLLAGAFIGALIGSLTGNAWPGVAAAIGIGLLLGWVLAVLAIRYRVDQIIIGVVINIFVLGLTSFLDAPRPGGEPPPQPGRHRCARGGIPGLGDIPIIGPIFFDQTIFVYASLILVARADLRPVPHPLGPAGPGGGRAPAGGRHGRHQRLSATATSTCCSAGRWPASAAPTSPSARWAASTRT